jgi:uncharacterized membrane protein
MNNRLVLGAVIAALVGLNLFQGAALLRMHRHKAEPAPVTLTEQHIKRLPQMSQDAVRPSLEQARPLLHARLKEAGHARRELTRYIASPNYNRAEAKKRFEDLRAKTNAAQGVAEDVLLDAADKLSPRDRALILKTVDG